MSNKSVFIPSSSSASTFTTTLWNLFGPPGSVDVWVKIFWNGFRVGFAWGFFGLGRTGAWDIGTFFFFLRAELNVDDDEDEGTTMMTDD